MAKYSVWITASAEKQLKKLPRNDQQQVAAAIMALAENPHPPGVRKLSGYDDVFRIRVGTYRILFSVSEAKVIVIILKIGHRRVYR